MTQTITITTKSMAEELNKWQLTNHNPFELKGMDEIESFDKNIFEKTLKKVSRKTPAPVAKMK